MRTRAVGAVPRLAPRRSRNVAPRLVLLAGLGLVLLRVGRQRPAFNVTGAWEGEPATLKTAAKGSLGEAAAGLVGSVAFHPEEGVEISSDGERVSATYATKVGADKALNLRINGEMDWIANLKGKDSSLRIRGKGLDLDTLGVEASKAATVNGLGHVRLDFNNDKDYNLTIVQDSLGNLGPVRFRGKARSTGLRGRQGFSGMLGARAQLPFGAQLDYSVSNPVGVYHVTGARHAAAIRAPLAGGVALLRAHGDIAAPALEASYRRGVLGGSAEARVSQRGGVAGYNVSWSRDFASAAPSVKPDLHVGMDERGAYTRLAASRQLGGLTAQYEAMARLGFDKGDPLKHLRQRHALRLSSKIGYAEVSHGDGEGAGPRLRLRSALEM